MFKFNSLLEQSGLEPEKTYLLRHEDSRLGRGRVFEAWLSHRRDFEEYQQNQDWSNRFEVGSNIASFVVPPSGESLFVGIYEVLALEKKVGVFNSALLGQFPPAERAWHEMELTQHLQNLIGKLVIEWGGGYINWRQRAHTQNKTILELRPNFVDEPFPGYSNFSCRLSELTNTYPSWKTMLENAKGIYLLVFEDDGMQYVGSATGTRGFLQRWEDYLANGHGGNRVLMRDERDARDSMVSILETSSSAQTKDEIIAREMHWQKILGARVKPLDDLQS